ncbi:hypothetical protein MMA231_04179 (plasmid) [Asticcacaulis sp. MM231]|uniref:hypothetical protein n=1 Tax=Asticcacaulis sp. MM231 TaxID=3157666 RepID=UPI0032D57CFB
MSLAFVGLTVLRIGLVALAFVNALPAVALPDSLAEALGLTGTQGHVLMAYGLAVIAFTALPLVKRYIVLAACLAYFGAVELTPSSAVVAGGLPYAWLADLSGVALAALPLYCLGFRSYLATRLTQWQVRLRLIKARRCQSVRQLTRENSGQNNGILSK